MFGDICLWLRLLLLLKYNRSERNFFSEEKSYLNTPPVASLQNQCSYFYPFQMKQSEKGK